ncbi:MAG: hypothetical protein AB1345_02345 [Chloroflexota bacterium]
MPILDACKTNAGLRDVVRFGIYYSSAFRQALKWCSVSFLVGLIIGQVGARLINLM